MFIMTKHGWRQLAFDVPEAAKVERINAWEQNFDRDHPTRPITDHRPAPVKWGKYEGVMMSEKAAIFADKMWQEVLSSRAQREGMKQSRAA